ncbi:hypothetical protein GJAV_G00084750 [Gymnothorax javanicus]|nr:hypothetical protein GJAV_G00084750 [Gymnothorax javanicus]
MMSIPLTLLGALVCAMNTHADVVPQKDFDLQKMAGKWYLTGFASNADWFTRRKSVMNFGTITMTPTATGNVTLSFASLTSNGSCWVATYLGEKTETPGRFTFYAARWKNENDMRIVDVKYDEYALIYTNRTTMVHTNKTAEDHPHETKAGASEVLTNLYTRNAQPSPELEEAFQKFSKEALILPENIVTQQNMGECQEAQDTQTPDGHGAEQS